MPWIAAGLGTLAARNARAQSFIDSRVLFYKEPDGRTQVINPVLFLNQDLGSRWGQLGVVLGYDAISGASPTGAYPTSDVTTSASGHLIRSGTFPSAEYRDRRKSASVSWGRKFGAHLPVVDFSYARENDYLARSIGLSDSWTMARGLGTLHYGVSFSRDVVSPVTTRVDHPKRENGYSLGWTQVLGERDVLDVSASLMQLSGYLDDPYKVVPVGDVTAGVTVPDHRPDARSRRALFVKYAHAYPWNAALHASYRYYTDSWGIRAHTIDLAYAQRIEPGWIVTPEARLYTQSRASFYGGSFPTPQEFMSSDYRLSAFGSVLGGLIVSKDITPELSAVLEGTIQSQRGRDRVVPIPTSPEAEGGGSISAADMNVWTATAGFTLRF